MFEIEFYTFISHRLIFKYTLTYYKIKHNDMNFVSTDFLINQISKFIIHP